MQLKADDFLDSLFRKAIIVKVVQFIFQTILGQNCFDTVKVIFLDWMLSVEVAELFESHQQIGMESLQTFEIGDIGLWNAN